MNCSQQKDFIYVVQKTSLEKRIQLGENNQGKYLPL